MSEFSSYQPPAMGGGGGSSGFGSQPNQFAGGFFPSSQDGGSLSQGGRPRSDHSKQQQSIIPVTCRQIYDLPDRQGGNAVIFTEGKLPQTITQVSLIGQISNISVEPSSVNFQLDDGTSPQVGAGGVRCRKYLSVDGQEDELTKQLRDGVYVSIVGTLPFPDDPRVVFAHHIRPLENFNELTFHLLDALHWYLRSMRGPIMDQQQQQQQQGGDSYAQMDIVETGNDAQNSMSPFLRDVLKVFVQHSGSNDDTGVHISVIMQNLPGRSEKQIRDAINELINLGEVYSTIDDDHHSYARA